MLSRRGRGRRGRSPLWLKVKNPNAPAVKREAEEDWGLSNPPTAGLLLHRSDDFAFQILHNGTKFAPRPIAPHEGGGRVVLNNLSEQIRECLRHAEECARKAAAQSCPKLKQDFLELEQRWLFLARSYEFTERLTDLSDETKRNVDKLFKAY